MGIARIGLLLIFAMTLGQLAKAQNYPTKPVRLVAAPAGGGNDFIARIIAGGISGPLGQSIIVDNRAARLTQPIVAQSPPDGYTLLIAGGTFMIVSLLEKTSYDPVKDFAPITSISRQPSVLVVHPSLPVASVKDLIAIAKARPGEINYAASGIGSPSHLAPELLMAMAKVKMQHVPYKGAGPAVTDLLAGQVQFAIMGALSGSIASHIKAGKLRAVAVTSTKPYTLLPDLPTISASGLPGYEVESIDSILAPAKTPPAIINRLNQEIVRFLAPPEIKQTFLNVGSEVATSTPQQLAATIQSEMAKWDKVIRAAGIRAE